MKPRPPTQLPYVPCATARETPTATLTLVSREPVDLRLPTKDLKPSETTVLTVCDRSGVRKSPTFRSAPIGDRGLPVSTCKNYFKKISSRQNSIFGLTNRLAGKNFQKSNSKLDLARKKFSIREKFFQVRCATERGNIRKKNKRATTAANLT